MTILTCEFSENVLAKMDDSCAIYVILGLLSEGQKAEKAIDQQYGLTQINRILFLRAWIPR